MINNNQIPAIIRHTSPATNHTPTKIATVQSSKTGYHRDSLALQ
jgi:hypothetical protein